MSALDKKNNCIFVVQSHFRSNSKINFHDKRALKGISNESAVSPFLECDCNPKRALAYKLFSTMQSEKQFVNSSQCAIFTAHQAKQAQITPQNFKTLNAYAGALLKSLQTSYQLLHNLTFKLVVL